MSALSSIESLASSPFFSLALNQALLEGSNPLTAVSFQQLQTNNALAQLLSNLASQSQSLFNAAQPLIQFFQPPALPQASSVLQERIVNNSNATLAVATVFPNATIGLNTLNVSQLAKAQQNLGPALASSGASTAASGNDTFDAIINGQTFSITVAVAAGDTNQSVISKLANAINAANVGIQAVALTSGSTSQIQLTAANTGTQNGFTLFDVTGNVISATGANQIQIQPQNAQFALNGTGMTSQSNRITLDSGNLILTLLGTSPNPAILSVGPNSQDVLTAFTNFINAYNSLQGLVNNQLAFLPQVKNLSTQSLITSQLAQSLQQIGVTIQGGGTLSLDLGTFNAALNGNFSQLQSALGGSQGLIPLVANAANQVIQYPPSLFQVSAGAQNTAQTSQILFLLSSSGILQPFFFQHGSLVNTFT